MAERTVKLLLECRDEGRIRVISIRLPEVYRAETLEQLGRQIRQSIEAAGAGGSFVLDLSQVKFLTSAAVGLVTNIWAHLNPRGYPFAVAGLAGEVARVIDTVRLSEVMPVFATVEEALAALRCE
ncbi:MAG: STAS domain-containing protein [Planctomycetota bacterium]|nr:STAS domain-containing protein [Planctomycetota bacterium]